MSEYIGSKINLLRWIHLSHNDNVVFAKFLCTFGAGGIPHIQVLQFEVLAFCESFKIFTPLPGIFKASFVHFT